VPDALSDLLPVLAPAMFVLVGAVFAVVGVSSLRSAREFRKDAQRVPGVVTDLRYVSSQGQSGGVYFPVLRFATADGRHVDTQGMDGRSPAPARVGQQVLVLYDPANPLGATIEGGQSGCLLAVFPAVGVVLLVVGVLVLALVVR